MRTTALVVTTILATLGLSGCSSAPWHEDMLSNDQLVRASCDQLAVEQQKIQDNQENIADGGNVSIIGGLLLATIEAMGASDSGSTYNANNSAGANLAMSGGENKQKVQVLEEKKSLIDMIRRKKGCV
jgi:outer membrane murein-binding lipoprotein Lpp